MSTNNMIKRINNPEGDLYETPPELTNKLLENEEFDRGGWVWEPACGNGAIVKVLRDHWFKNIEVSDISDSPSMDFLSFEFSHDKESVCTPDNFITKRPDYIITNPPFKLALPFVQQALKFARKKVAMLLRMQFYETKGRYQFLKENPPIRIYSFSDRPNMKGIDSGMMWFAWFVWEIGYKGPTTIMPILSKEG